MALAATSTLGIAARLTKALDLSTPVSVVEYDKTETWADSGADHVAEHLYHDQITLADAAATTVQLSALTDALGTDIGSMDELQLLYVHLIDNGDGGGLLIGGAGANSVDLFADVSDIAAVAPGGTFIMTWPAGLAIGTDDDLKLTHDGGGTTAIEVVLIVLGNTA